MSPGQKVTFSIHGYGDQDFTGKITRVNPAANATTRQVEVLVSLDKGQALPGVAGLYAEGRVETRHAVGLSLPADIVVRDGDNASAWRVHEGKMQKVPLALGDRDPRSGEYIIKGGVAEGDVAAALSDFHAARRPGCAATRELTHVPLQFQHQESGHRRWPSSSC